MSGFELLRWSTCWGKWIRFLSVNAPCLPFRAEKFPRSEHPEIIDSLAKEGSKIPAIQREKHIGTCERCAEDRLVLCDLKKQRPIKSQFIILDNEPVFEIKPNMGCRMRQTSQILAHFPHHPMGNHQLPILRSREFENEPRSTRFRETGGQHHAGVEKNPQRLFRKRSPSASSSASMEEISPGE